MINYLNVADVLNSGKVAVIPTDTIYGVVARAADEEAVKKVYKIRQRDIAKPCIILIADLEQLKDFDIDKKYLDVAKKYWPGPVSLIFPTHKTGINHLTKNTGTIALRLPDNNELRQLIRQTGPLIAPSANPEGLPPATTIDKAKAYFGNQVDIYVDNGPMPFEPSTLIDLAAQKVLR
jgi:L-threonylcarbamoyladenylate synthase